MAFNRNNINQIKKNYEKCFLFRSRDFNFLYFFPSFPQFQDSKEQMEVE